MANRPNRNRKVEKKKTQAEINRTKAAGVLTLDTLKQKSDKINTINVQLPDKDILEFYHLPMTCLQAEEFFQAIKDREDNVIAIKKSILTEQMVNKDGSKFVESVEAWDDIDVQAVNAIFDAILESPRTEAGED